MLGSVTPASARGVDDAPETRTLVHILDYLSADYVMAVQNGTVINEGEYQEMLAFSAQSASLITRLIELGELDESGEAIDRIRRLDSLIVAKAEPSVVSSYSRALRDLVIEETGLTITPSRWPDIDNGEVLYLAFCADCHGQDGGG